MGASACRPRGLSGSSSLLSIPTPILTPLVAPGLPSALAVPLLLCAFALSASSGSTECTGLCLLLAFAVALLAALLIVGGLALWQIQRIVAKQRGLGLSRPKHGAREPQPSPDGLSLSLDAEHSGNGQGDLGSGSGGSSGVAHRGSSGGGYEREDSSGGGSGGGVHVQMHGHRGARRENLREIELDEEEDLSEL